jgi:hypothetical protein
MQNIMPQILKINWTYPHFHDVFPKLLEGAREYGAVDIINPGQIKPQEVVGEVARILDDLNK